MPGTAGVMAQRLVLVIVVVRSVARQQQPSHRVPRVDIADTFLAMQGHAIAIVQSSMQWLKPRAVDGTVVVVPSNFQQLDLALNWRIWAAAHDRVVDRLVYQCLDEGGRDLLARHGEPCLYTDYKVNTTASIGDPFGEDWGRVGRWKLPLIAALIQCSFHALMVDSDAFLLDNPCAAIQNQCPIRVTASG